MVSRNLTDQQNKETNIWALINLLEKSYLWKGAPAHSNLKQA